MNDELIKTINTLGIITTDDVERLTAVKLLMLLLDWYNELIPITKQYISKVDNLFEEIEQVTEEEVVSLLNMWKDDGTFNRLINQIALAEVNGRIDDVHLILDNEVNLASYGVATKQNQDISDILIQAIDDIKSQYSNTDYNGKICTLVIPHGVYYITKQIKIPMFIQLKTQGNVVLMTNVPNTSALWFYADDDPAVDGYENDWFRGKTIGELIDGSNGGLFLKNKVDTVYYKGNEIGEPQGAIGLEIGSRNETAPWRISSFLTVKNIRIERYHIGLLCNSYHFYINKFSKVMCAFNDVSIQLGNGSELSSDSGENILFDFCTIANSKVGLLIAKNGYGCALNNCSIDYNVAGIISEKPTGATILCYNCNIEGCLTEAYNNTLTTKLTPYKEGYYGVFRNSTSDGFYQTSIYLRDTKIVPTRGTGNLFTGVEGKTNVYFEGVQIFTPMEATKYLYLPDWLYMCSNSVNVERDDVSYVDRMSGAYVSRNNSLIRNANFDVSDVGDKGAVTSGMSLSGFEFWEPSNITTCSVINSTMGRKAMSFVTTEDSKIKVQTKESIIVKPNQSLSLFASFKFTGKMQIGLRLEYLDSKGSNIGFSNTIYLSYSNSSNNFYSAHEKIKFKAGAGVQYVKPNWIFVNTESTSNEFQITNLHCYEI